jgi:hypothetical protein
MEEGEETARAVAFSRDTDPYGESAAYVKPSGSALAAANPDRTATAVHQTPFNSTLGHLISEKLDEQTVANECLSEILFCQ